MSRKCETCFLRCSGECPFNYACRFPVYERFGNRWQKIRYKQIQQLEQRMNQNPTFFGISSVGAKEVAKS